MLTAFIIHLSSYWLSVLYLYKYDKNYTSKSLMKWKKYKKAVKISLFNQFCITLPLLYLLKNYITKSFLNNDVSNIIIIRNILFILTTSGLLFYGFHYMLHKPYLYKKIHKMHHEFIIPVAPASLYAHPIEHILCNNLSFLIPFIIFGTTKNISYLLIILGSIMVTSAHVDYNFPLFGYSHVIHHKKYKYNYGFGNVFDQIFSTHLGNI